MGLRDCARQEASGTDTARRTPARNRVRVPRGLHGCHAP